MFLNKEQLYDLIREYRFKIPKLTFDILRKDEEEVLLEASKSFGFQIDKTSTLLEKTKEEVVLKEPRALLFITGPFSFPEKTPIANSKNHLQREIKVCQLDQVNFRLREISKKLIKDKKVSLYKGCGEEWLYEALSDTYETVLYDHLLKSFPGLPIYKVAFETSGDFKIEELDTV